MLLGRAGEVGRIRGLLDAAASDRASAALIVHGEPGIGKTTLLDQVAAQSEGFTVLRAQPLEAEAELPFAGLYDLVRPIQHVLERIPDPQRAALSGALALGPPVPGDRFAVAAATLSLLAGAADDAPVLAIVDDAQWLDRTSRDALLFAGRRLANEGVVLLFAMRDRGWMTGAGIETFALGGLEPAAAAALVDSTGVAVDTTVRRRLVDETRGNPLAILEAIAMLTAAELRGAVPIARPLAVGGALEQSFARQLDGLPEPARHALLIAAASDSGATGEIMRALAARGLDRAGLEPAERAGLITVTPERAEFRHPLVRSAAYHMHDAVERRAAHHAFAIALGEGERFAWHLAAASDGPDETVAAQLETAAGGAMARSAYGAAASAFETAAVLSPDDDRRLRRTIGAGRALWLGGEPQRAAALLEGVLDLATEPVVRADLQQLRCAALLFARPVSESHAALVEEAERVLPFDGARAADLFANASLINFPRGDFVNAEDCARRSLAAAEPDSAAATVVAPALLGSVHALRGQVEAAWALLEPVAGHTELVRPRGALFGTLSAMPQTLMWLERWELAGVLFDRVVAAARSTGGPSLLPFPLSVQAEYELHRGRLAAAYAHATESVQLAAATGQTLAGSFSFVALARVEAALGHEQDCRAHVGAALELSRPAGADSIEGYAAAALGHLELALGHPDRAIAHLIEADRIGDVHAMVLPTVVKSGGDLVEAYVRAGAPDEARRALAVLEQRADATGLRWPCGAAARSRGLLAEDFEPEFAAALEQFGDDMAFERARTLLCLGMRRRRTHRRAQAREPLRQALEYFEAAGAEPWADQVRAELTASGETTAPNGDGSLRPLTPQELQVALTVAKGVTNREAAASLFLSEKTVEFHLSNTYRKLGLRSRAALIRKIEGLP